MASNLAQIRNNKDFWREIAELAYARYLKTCQVSHGEYYVWYTVNGVTEKLFFILGKCDGYTRTECTLLKHRMITCCV